MMLLCEISALYPLKNVKWKSGEHHKGCMWDPYMSMQKEVFWGEKTFFILFGRETLCSFYSTEVSFDEIGELLDLPSRYQSYFAG